VSTVHGQFTNDTLNYIDDLTIGSRYTVRGFDGETMLAAEQGFYWRNEVQAPLGQTGQSVYAGLDYGRVWGPSTRYLAGTQLAGAVVGLRGALPFRLGGVSYDLFVGTPVYKPSGFDTARRSSPPDANGGSAAFAGPLDRLCRCVRESGWRCLSTEWNGYHSLYVFECVQGHRCERSAAGREGGADRSCARVRTWRARRREPAAQIHGRALRGASGRGRGDGRRGSGCDGRHGGRRVAARHG